MTQASSFQLRDHFPCIHLFRAVGIAFDVRKLILGAIAWIVLAVGQAGIAYLPFAPEGSPKEIQWPHSVVQPVANQGARDGRTTPPVSNHGARGGRTTQPRDEFRDSTPSPLGRLTTGWGLLTYPIQTIVEPGKALLTNGNTWSQVAYAWTRLIWAFVVWSLFGVAISRMAVMQFVTLDRIRIIDAMKFSVRQLQSTCTAPFLPLLAFGAMFGVTSLAGLASSALPTQGSFVFGTLWIVVLLVGFLMALLLIGITLTWPLMIATIGSEDSDAFDALSRAFGYLLDRPWYLLILSSIALVAGSIGWAVLNVMFGLAEYLATWSLTAGSGVELSTQLLRGADGFAPKAATAWQRVFTDILAGYIPAFFFTASTLIYLLVRQSDDGTGLDVIINFEQPAKPSEESEVAVDEAASTDEPKPEQKTEE
jgi:hypothetical protein